MHLIICCSILGHWSGDLFHSTVAITQMLIVKKSLSFSLTRLHMLAHSLWWLNGRHCATLQFVLWFYVLAVMIILCFQKDLWTCRDFPAIKIYGLGCLSVFAHRLSIWTKKMWRAFGKRANQGNWCPLVFGTHVPHDSSQKKSPSRISQPIFEIVAARNTWFCGSFCKKIW